MAKSFKEYQLQTAEMWRGINSEIASIRTTALDRMQNAAANGFWIEGIRSECESIRSWERMQTDELIQKGQRAEVALQSACGWTE